jgi:DNA primase
MEQRYAAAASYGELATLLKSRIDLPAYMRAQGVRFAREQVNRITAYCCFHQDDSPSLSISRKNGVWVWYCFGCHKKGTVIDFYQTQHPNSGWREVLGSLAEWARIPFMPNWDASRQAHWRPAGRPSPEADDARRLFHAVANIAQGFLQAQALTGGYQPLPPQREPSSPPLPPDRVSEGCNYLASRGIMPEEIETWHLGWLPSGGIDSAISQLARERPGSLHHWRNLARQLGIPHQTDQGGNLHFTVDGLVIPLCDEGGECIGLAFRGGKEGSKYRNTVNVPGLYDKSQYLYGARRPTERSRQPLLIVEGYFDAITARRCGFEAVAICGSRLTDQQAEVLRRLASGWPLILAFDGDAPGLQATIDAIPRLTSHGLETRVLRPPDGADPDSDLRSRDGADRWQRLVRQAPEGWVWLLSESVRQLRESRAATNGQNVVHHLRAIRAVLRRVEESVDSLEARYPDRAAEWKAVPAGLALYADRLCGVADDRSIFAAGRLPPVEPEAAANLSARSLGFASG